MVLLNPSDKRQKAAWGTIGAAGGGKWHTGIIPPSWYRVDIGGVYQNIDLMMTHEPGDQFKLNDVIGGNVIWESSSMRLKTD